MSDKINVTSLRSISEIKRVYSGHPGCACGCQGTYYPNNSQDSPSKKDLTMIKKVHNIFQNNLANVYTWESHKDHFIAFDLSPARTYTIYYK